MRCGPSSQTPPHFNRFQRVTVSGHPCNFAVSTRLSPRKVQHLASWPFPRSRQRTHYAPQNRGLARGVATLSAGVPRACAAPCSRLVCSNSSTFALLSTGIGRVEQRGAPLQPVGHFLWLVALAENLDRHLASLFSDAGAQPAGQWPTCGASARQRVHANTPLSPNELFAGWSLLWRRRRGFRLHNT